MGRTGLRTTSEVVLLAGLIDEAAVGLHRLPERHIGDIQRCAPPGDLIGQRLIGRSVDRDGIPRKGIFRLGGRDSDRRTLVSDVGTRGIDPDELNALRGTIDRVTGNEMTLSVANNGLHGVGPGESRPHEFLAQLEYILRSGLAQYDRASRLCTDARHRILIVRLDNQPPLAVGRVDDLIAEHRRPVKLDRGYASLIESRYGEKGQSLLVLRDRRVGDYRTVRREVEKQRVAQPLGRGIFGYPIVFEAALVGQRLLHGLRPGSLPCRRAVFLGLRLQSVERSLVATARRESKRQESRQQYRYSFHVGLFRVCNSDLRTGSSCRRPCRRPRGSARRHPLRGHI